MKKNFLSDLPWVDELAKKINGEILPPYREVNGHIHSPYSFSSFDSLYTAFRMAREENISVLGINDFYVTDGYETFYNGCLQHDIFPLFNIEFIGLLKEEQKRGTRINDPNNPGRIYFSGKGLDYPFNPGWLNKLIIRKVTEASQKQMKAMISRLNTLLLTANPTLSLDYYEIKKRFAKDLVRERHLAKALRHLAVENYNTPEEQIAFIETLYGGKKSKTAAASPAALENEIRSNLLKAGGAAFVEEDEGSFPELKRIIKIIIRAGGIPCYPVLLDDASGKFTEFEAVAERLYHSLKKLNIGCIELIPGRNDLEILKKFCEFFNKRDFVILFGTEHNTPDLAPLSVTARGSVPLEVSLKKIAWEGACIVAAHQYLRAQGRQGYVLTDGSLSHDQKHELARLGQIVIEYYLNRRKYESAN